MAAKKNSFKGFINKLNNLPLKKRQDFVDKKLKSFKKFPIINKDDVIFVYKGDGAKVELAGDMTVWQLFPIPLKKIDGTNLFYLEAHYEIDAVLDYKFLVDNVLILDPLNKTISRGGFGTNSELIMPAYKKHAESNFINKIPHGKVIETHIECEAIKKGIKVTENRGVKIYLPPYYNKRKKYKALYFKDGSDYLRFGKASHILDFMIKNKEIEPVIAVFIDPIDRDEDYLSKNKDVYVDFFVNNFIPWIERDYSINPDERTLIGCSASCNITTYIAYKYPEKFQYLLCHSGDILWAYVEENNLPTINYPLKIFISVGSYDLDNISTDIWFYSDLKQNPSVKAIELKRYPQGHRWGLWRDTLREGLIWLHKK